MSTDQVGSIVPLPHRGLHLDPPSESHYSNSSTSLSPDSSSSFSNLCDREANSFPDINMLAYCLNEGSPVDNSYNTTLPQGDVFSGVSMNLNQTFIATPVNGSMHIWNENFSLVGNQETWSEKYETFHKNTEDQSKGLVTSPDSAGSESQLSSCEISRGGSSENSRYSLSSGEMLIRSNSFCLEDQSLLVVSSLDESSVSPAVGHPALPIGSNLLSTTLPDVCEKSTERIVEESLGHPCLGMTFIKTDNSEFLTEENLTASISLVTLPNENEGGLLMTFVCDTSSENSEEEAKFASDAELLPHFPGAVTPEQGKTFVSTLSAMQETDKAIHTSTPVQNIGNKIPSLPSFSESPCTGNTSSAGINPVKEQPISVTPKERLVAGLPPSASQVKKMELKSVPKSDFGSIKSKVVTRTGPQVAVQSPASHLKPSQMSLNNKHTETNKGGCIRISPIKVRNGLKIVSITTKMVNGAQRRINTGVANLGVTVIQSSAHTAVDSQDNNRASPPDHPASNKHSSGSALGQDKPPVLKTRPRFSSESSSSRPPKEKRISASFTIPKADIHPGQTKAGNLNCSSQNKRAIQTDTSNRSTENSSREVKKISLIVSMDLK